MDIKLKFDNDISKKGTTIKYIHFEDEEYRLSDSQKEVLKEICSGYFFFSKAKRMWGFTDRGNNELNVFNFLINGKIPEYVNNQIKTRNLEIKKAQIPFVIEDFEIKFIEISGRPLFYHENINGKIEININLKHWFFEKKDETEKEIVKKMVLCLVATELEFTSQLIESFFTKLNSFQESLKYEYGKCK